MGDNIINNVTNLGVASAAQITNEINSINNVTNLGVANATQITFVFIKLLFWDSRK